MAALRAGLLASSALLAVSVPAAAADIAWNLDGTGNYGLDTNWTPATVPGLADTAVFGTSNQNNVLVNDIFSVLGWTFNPGASDYSFTIAVPDGILFNGAGIVINGGSATITNNYFLIFNASSTAGSATITNNAFLVFSSGTAGSATITNNLSLRFQVSGTADAATITTTAGAAINGFGTLFENNATGGTSRHILTASGLLDITQSANAGITVGSVEGSGVVAIGGKTLTVGVNDLSTTFSGVIQNQGNQGGSGALAGSLVKTGAGTLTLTGANTYTGTTTISAGTLRLGNGGASGSIVGDVTNNAAFAFNRSDLFTFGGLISGTGSVQQNGIGTTVLTNNNAYTGATAVNGGALIVNGSIASSSGLTVDPGALVGGTGFLPTTTINGTLSPGNSIGTITVSGNLAFGAGGQYVVEVSPTAADRTNVTGTATLNGTVLAIFAPGSYITRQYTILSAAGGRIGAFSALTTTGLPPGFSSNLGYSATDVVLNLTAQLGQPQQMQPSGPSPLGGVLPRNPYNVATAINGFFNNGGVLPPNFLPLFGLTGTNLVTALNQLSGEAATAAQYGAFQLGNQFFALMLDPLVYGRGPGVGIVPGGGAMRLAAEETQPPEIALAYAKILKEPPAPAPFLWERRWNVWAGGYGGTNRTEGDPVVVGSHDVTARTGGYGAGVDYRIWPGTTVGVALAGGFTNWGLASGLGGGNSDVFQAGLYGITRNGPAYVAGALAFAEHWMTTDRFAFAGDHLTARFNAQNYGGRLEGGWRFATFLGGVAPYAAVQAQGFHTPAYNETDATLGGFGLNYNARNGSDTRSELGARFDKALPIATTAVLALNARAAWAHDWVTTPVLNPFFQTLPGTLFAVTGATPVPNSALASAGGELRFLNGWVLAARFDGEFANRAQTYAGTGTLRYTW
jgi:autotransporter-associated beta strand protein